MDDIEKAFDLLFDEIAEELVIRFAGNINERRAAIDGIILNLQQQGVDVEALAFGGSSLVRAEVEAITNSIISQIVGSTRQVAQLGVETFQRQNHGEGQLYRWQTESGNPCPDCASRAGYEPTTMDEWQLIGLPRQGATVCNVHCMCVLVRE